MTEKKYAVYRKPIGTEKLHTQIGKTIYRTYDGNSSHLKEGQFPSIDKSVFDNLEEAKEVMWRDVDTADLLGSDYYIVKFEPGDDPLKKNSEIVYGQVEKWSLERWKKKQRHMMLGPWSQAVLKILKLRCMNFSIHDFPILICYDQQVTIRDPRQKS